ncbi:MAG TPA: hypothetical protein DCY13_03855 [Verrucomicrobiales bacterium]|nr:hypothetical protein [Verrucomicrobiales bacterium]
MELESRFGRSVSPSDPVTLSVANGQAGGAAGASGQPASVAAGRTSYFFDSATTSSASNEGGLTHDLYAKAPATERWHFAQDSLATTTADVRTKSELDTRAKELADIRGGVRQQAAQRLAEREVEQLGEARVPSSGPAPVTRRFAGRNGLNEEWGAEVPALRQSEELVRSKDADGTRLNETRELAEATSSIDTLALESAPAEVLAKQVADVELKKVAAPDDKSDAFGAVGFSVLPGEQGAQSEAKIVDAQTAAADRFDRLARGESALGLQQVEGFSNEPGWVGALEQPAPSGAANGRFLGRSLHLDSRLAGLPPEGVVANSSDDGGIGGGGYGSSAVSAQEGPALDGGPQAGWGGIRFVTPAEDLPAGNQAVRAKLAEAEEAARGGELFEATRLFGDSMTLAGQSGDASAIEQAKRGLVNSRLAMASQAREAKDFELAAEQVDEVLKIAPDDVQVLKLKVVNDRELLVNEGRQSNKQAIQTAPPPPSLEPLPEISTKDNAFSTFSLNVSDVSYQLAKSALENGQLPDPARIRSEEFVNAFDYRDPAPAAGQRVAFNWERARNPFAHNRDLLRFSVQTAAAGREPGKALNLVILLDNSGSMERADRVRIVEEMMGVLAGQLQAQDRVSVISFARTARLLVDGMTGDSQQELLYRTTGLNPQGGTNLEDAMKLGYEVAQRHFQAEGNNRVIVLTDGAANLGNVDPQALRERVIAQRQKGIALDCFGIGWEGYNDNLLEQLSRNGDGRYGFINDPAAARTQFANQLAGALQVAAADVKAQVEFNPDRVTVYRQIGYQQHQLTKEQFRDNTVDAAEIGAAESGNALYSVQIDPNGTGPIGTFRVRYRVPSTGAYEEKEFVLAFQPTAPEMQAASPAMRLATTAASFAEWLANSPHAGMVDTGTLRNLIGGVPEVFAPDPRAAQLQLMIQQAAAISGR